MDNYKNIILSRNAWICKFFEPSFDAFEDKKKTETSKLNRYLFLVPILIRRILVQSLYFRHLPR